MYKLNLIPHAKINSEILSEIIRIKTKAWSYSYEEQVEWINEHLKSTDLHLILLKENKSVAYLNLIAIELIIDNIPYNTFGVGNVCAVEKSKGYGAQLIKLTNSILLNKNIPGLLFCRPSLVSFYQQYNWKIIDKEALKVLFDNSDIETMLLGNINFRNVVYNGIIF